MAYVGIHKDLNKVKTKVALNLTKRQMIGFTIAGVIGFLIYLSIKDFLSTDISMIIMSIFVLPVIFITLYEKDGMPFEKYAKYVINFHRNRKIRVLKTQSIYDVRRR